MFTRCRHRFHAQEHAAPDPPVGGPLECCTSRAMAAALQAIPASADKRPALLVLNISFLPKHIRDGKADRQEAHIHIQLSLNSGGGRKLQRHDLSVRLRKPHRSAHLPKFSCETVRPRCCLNISFLTKQHVAVNGGGGIGSQVIR